MEAARDVRLDDLPTPPVGRVGWPWTEAPSPLPDCAPDGSAWPRISIVTPSYNQGQYIEETIRSILLQGYPNLEYLIYDGGSTDGAIEVIRKYERWLDFWISEPDRGQADAINKGFRRATGTLLQWINSDDVLAPGALARVAVAHLAHPTSLILGDVVNFETGTRHQSLVRQSNLSFENMVGMWHARRHFSWHQPGIFVPTCRVSEVGLLDESLRFAFDRDWMCRLLRVADVHHTLSEVVRFRLHRLSKTIAESHTVLPEQRRVTERFLDQLPPNEAKAVRAGLELYAADVYLNRYQTMRREAIRHFCQGAIKSPQAVVSLRIVRMLAKIMLPVGLWPSRSYSR